MKGGAMTTIHRETIEWCDIWIRGADRTDQPRVLFIGDSICRGYYPHVEKLLEGKLACARVATSRFVSDPVYQQELALVLGQYRFQAIHVNNGLHGWDYSEDDYAIGLIDLIAFLRRLAPTAQLIWAQSTPIHLAGEPGRFDPRHQRVMERNRLASRVMAGEGIPLNDLFSLAVGQSAWFTADGIHYTAEGSAALGAQVAAHVAAGFA